VRLLKPDDASLAPSGEPRVSPLAAPSAGRPMGVCGAAAATIRSFRRRGDHLQSGSLACSLLQTGRAATLWSGWHEIWPDHAAAPG